MYTSIVFSSNIHTHTSITDTFSSSYFWHYSWNVHIDTCMLLLLVYSTVYKGFWVYVLSQHWTERQKAEQWSEEEEDKINQFQWRQWSPVAVCTKRKSVACTLFWRLTMMHMSVAKKGSIIFIILSPLPCTYHSLSFSSSSSVWVSVDHVQARRRRRRGARERKSRAWSGMLSPLMKSHRWRHAHHIHQYILPPPQNTVSAATVL